MDLMDLMDLSHDYSRYITGIPVNINKIFGGKKNGKPN